MEEWLEIDRLYIYVLLTGPSFCYGGLFVLENRCLWGRVPYFRKWITMKFDYIWVNSYSSDFPLCSGAE